MKQQRMIRILDYVGTPEWIASCLRTRSLQGQLIVPNGAIKESNVILRPIVDLPEPETFSDGSSVTDYETIGEMVERVMS